MTSIQISNDLTGTFSLQVDAYFFQHHINAYEINDGREVIVDLSPSDPWGLAEYVKMENMLNPPEFSNGSNADGVGEAEITRYHFHLDTGSVETIAFPNLMEKENALSRYINKFDFPTINEAYRGKEVITSFSPNLLKESLLHIFLKILAQNNFGAQNHNFELMQYYYLLCFV